MRLSNRIKITLLKAIKEAFGEVDIYLFGSRVDDNKKGGDIDIAIDCSLSKQEFREKKSKVLANLIRVGFDIKIDLVEFKNENLLLFKEIKESSVKLL